MTSSILKQFARATLALASILILAPGSHAAAQSKGERGLEGTWRVQVTLHNCVTGAPLSSFKSLLSFARGGTLTGTTANPAFLPGQRTPDLGIWSRDDGHTYHAVSEAFILFNSSPNPPIPGFQRGVQRITQAIDVKDDQFTSVASVQFFDVAGNVLVTACADAVAQRFN